ncbi:MOSC domain-containing protein [uncultured Croceitalea sp.]|uniref:MOSC domain-containing protein n=1 Tax=uncultured Croceitalea sp. TaxID=1798908 RepID=UPI003305FD07
MKIIATNIGPATKVEWNGKTIETGIFKYPTEAPIYLEKEDVASDTVIDRKHHGGEFKACYLFSSDQYPFWKAKYPHLEWNWGMFGENLTVEGLDEANMRIGNVYKVGSALVQISQPREPCFKLGIRFGTQNILKEFIDHEYSGTYVKIIEKGKVEVGDTLTLVKESDNSLSVKQYYKLLFAKEKDMDTVRLALGNEALPLYKRQRLQKYL